MLKHFLLLCIVLLTCCTVYSQYEFIEKGRIVFERKINTHAVLPAFVLESKLVTKEELGAYVQDYKSRNPQFWIDSFQLVFDKEATAYEPVGTVSKFLYGTGTPIANTNKVFIDLSKSTFFAEKNAHNETKLISDSVNKIRWKLTDETREIAGYECRRANAIIRDSIYIVAFYTDAIKPKGGPELFNGLPGMILGVALPHYHITYFATGVQSGSQFTKPVIPKTQPQQNITTQKVFINEGVNFLKSLNIFNSWSQVFISL